MRSLCLWGLTLIVTTAPLEAQVRVNPSGVNVSAMNATTVFLTYGGVRSGLQPAEAHWCGELVPATPDVGSRCKPGTIFGSLPSRYDLSRSSGASAFTDIMSIPASVARRAYQDARRGETSSFFYVRRFVNSTGGPDEYVAVTCRPSGGGARTPFALTDVRVGFDGRDEVHFVPSGQLLPTFGASITYNGTGRLIGRWEVVMPGEEAPSALDLLPEGSLPPEERVQQRRYTQLERFNVFVPPGGKLRLEGPDPARLPTALDGSYLVLLRIEASDDREGDSNLGAVGAGLGIVHAGAIAGFPMPILRYVVAGEGSPGGSGSARLVPLAPRDGAVHASDSVSPRLVWSPDRQATLYRIEVQNDEGASIIRALVTSSQRHYVVPLATLKQAGGMIRWRISALDDSGSLVRRTPWRSLKGATVRQ